MLNKIIKFLKSSVNESKNSHKNPAINFSVSDNGVIEIGDFETSFIPNRPSFSPSKTKITNTQFKSIRLLKDLTPDQIFYLNSLDLGYARQFEDKEFLELQTIKLYLDLCQQTDIYLKQKNTNLEKRSKKMEHGYMSYDNTFYSLYFVSETNVEEFYYGRSQRADDYSFSLLQEQIDSGVVDYLKGYLKIRIPKLPEVPENLRSQIYSNLNTYQILGLAFKRLELECKQKFYLEAIPFYPNIFTEIDQCLDETIKLYIKSITYVLDKSNEYDRKSVLNAFNSAPKKNEYGGYNQAIYESGMSKILQALFSISQNRIKESYQHSRFEDITYKKGYLTKKLGKEIKEELEVLLSSYEPEVPTKETQIALNAKNKTKWKNELKNLLGSNLDLSNLKQKCDELLELNSRNASQYLIYFELCKNFAKKSKTASLWYYYKYYELLAFKNGDLFNSPDPKPLPASIIKIIFERDEKKLKQFEIICKTRNPLNNSEEAKKEEIKGLFRIKRKELKLDLSETQKAHQSHTEMTAKLNQVLQEEEVLKNQQEEEPTQVLKNPKPEINQKQSTIEVNNKTASLQDFFATGSDSTNQNSDIDFNEIETEFLALFRKNNFQLNDSQVSDFAKSQKQFKNSLIKKINQKFYEVYEDNLIEQEDKNYLISNHNQNLI